MKKTTAYARKCKLKPVVNGAAWLDSIQRCAPYSDDPIIGSWLPGTQVAATNSMKLVRDAFNRLKYGLTPKNDTDDYDKLTHAMGISCIRAAQIAGDDVNENIMLKPLTSSNYYLRAILNRRRKFGKWQVLPVEADGIDYAIEIYETIVQASSPMQLTQAIDMRMLSLCGAVQESLEVEE